MSLAQDANSRSALTVLARVQKLTVPLPGDVRIDHLARTGERRAMSLPVCSACNVERTLTAVEPLVKGHDIRSFECPVCQTILRLVVRRDPTLLKEVVGHS
jgi:hypothetical protein